MDTEAKKEAEAAKALLSVYEKENAELRNEVEDLKRSKSRMVQPEAYERELQAHVELQTKYTEAEKENAELRRELDELRLVQSRSVDPGEWEKKTSDKLKYVGELLGELDKAPSTPSSTRSLLLAQHLAMIEILALRNEEAAWLKKYEQERSAHTQLQIKCGMCICGDGATDECCPQCIPNPGQADIFARYEAAEKFIEKVRRIGKSSAFTSVFSMAQLHHAGYAWENWQAEMDAFDRACGRQPQPPPTPTTLCGPSPQ